MVESDGFNFHGIRKYTLGERLNVIAGSEIQYRYETNFPPGCDSCCISPSDLMPSSPTILVILVLYRKWQSHIAAVTFFSSSFTSPGSSLHFRPRRASSM